MKRDMGLSIINTSGYLYTHTTILAESLALSADFFFNNVSA